jgi:hypothetical protein
VENWLSRAQFSRNSVSRASDKRFLLRFRQTTYSLLLSTEEGKEAEATGRETQRERNREQFVCLLLCGRTVIHIEKVDAANFALFSSLLITRSFFFRCLIV